MAIGCSDPRKYRHHKQGIYGVVHIANTLFTTFKIVFTWIRASKLLRSKLVQVSMVHPLSVTTVICVKIFHT